jgi:hypothetical protein
VGVPGLRLILKQAVDLGQAEWLWLGRLVFILVLHRRVALERDARWVDLDLEISAGSVNAMRLAWIHRVNSDVRFAALAWWRRSWGYFRAWLSRR